MGIIGAANAGGKAQSRGRKPSLTNKIKKFVNSFDPPSFYSINYIQLRKSSGVIHDGRRVTG
jgi:hypothetical protein